MYSVFVCVAVRAYFFRVCFAFYAFGGILGGAWVLSFNMARFWGSLGLAVFFSRFRLRRRASEAEKKKERERGNARALAGR